MVAHLNYTSTQSLIQTFRRVDQSLSYPVRDLTDCELVCRQVVLLLVKLVIIGLRSARCVIFAIRGQFSSPSGLLVDSKFFLKSHFNQHVYQVSVAFLVNIS